MDNPYEYIKNNQEIRPFNEKGEKDGNFNYVHQTIAWNLASEIIRLRKIIESK